MLYPLDSSEFIGFALPTGQMQKGRAHVCSALSVARVGPRVALRKTSVNTLSKRSPISVEITHPTHPLRGQTFAISPFLGGKPDSDSVLIELPNGDRQLIPLTWTNLHPQTEYPPQTCFLPDCLVKLRQRLDELIHRQEEEQVTLMATELDRGEPGGSHGESQTDLMGSVEPGITCSDYCHPGADATAPLGSGNGGAS
jgi:hypothetical protein